MTELNKCFCEKYTACQTDPNTEVPIWDGTITAEEFIKKADDVCTGTRVYLGTTVLNSENVIVDQDSVTLPREAVNLQCEFYRSHYAKM
jgi:hypothetical protein